jgi:hypothetical protein
LAQLLLAVGQLGAHLLEGGLLAYQRLCHVIEQAWRALLELLLDPGLGVWIARSPL